MSALELSTNTTSEATATALSNWNTTMEYARIKNKARAEQTDSDLTYLVYVSFGLLVMFIVYVLLLYRTKRSDREDGDFCPDIHLVNPEDGSVPVISAMMTNINKGSSPPPYEHPPPYHVALNMERRKENNE